MQFSNVTKGVQATAGTALRSASRNAYLWRNLIAIAGILSLALPWVYLDGSNSSLSGSELIAYTFINGDERWDMLKQSPFGALALFFVPLVTAGFSIRVFLYTFKDRPCLRLNAAAGLLPALVVLLSGGVTSSEHLVGGFVSPGLGVIAAFLCQLVLAVHSVWAVK